MVRRGQTTLHDGQEEVVSRTFPSPAHSPQNIFRRSSVILTLNSIIKKFFWGGREDSNRYLAWCQWDEVIRPKFKGGLGVRDLQTLNHALILKLMWKLASNNSAIWVDQLRGKYYPRSNFWTTRRASDSSSLWKALMKMRPTIQDVLSWELGNGRSVHAFGQPWFNSWRNYAPRNKRELTLRVSDLFDHYNNTWNMELLYTHFPNTPSSAFTSVIYSPNRRFPQTNQQCPQCNAEPESIPHILMYCSSAMATWNQTETIIIDQTTNSGKQLLTRLLEANPKEKWPFIASVLWAI
ncbi:hypothetical protein LUZ60_017387 [Juncus effusus]|nr:hypothetical protein LUZ60_017387 [Juncus effusus]